MDAISGAGITGGQSPGGSRMERFGLTLAMAVAAINVWTGSPLLALWVGSRFQGQGPPKMSSVIVVVVVMAAVSFLLVRLLAVLGSRYDRLTGHTLTVRTHAPWLRSMRGEREQHFTERVGVSMLERILVVMVVAVILLFEVWFFFFSGSPIDQRTGRVHLDLPAAGQPV